MSGVGGKNEGVDFQLRGHTTSMLILFHVWEFGVCIEGVLLLATEVVHGTGNLFSAVISLRQKVFSRP